MRREVSTLFLSQREILIPHNLRTDTFFYFVLLFIFLYSTNVEPYAISMVKKQQKNKMMNIFKKNNTGRKFRYSGSMRPGIQSPQKVVPSNDIMQPNYAIHGMFNHNRRLTWNIDVKNQNDINHMRVAGRIAREILDIAGQAVNVGVTTDEIDTIVHYETLKRKAYPSPLNYKGFPKSCCTSVNEVICHGIPDNRKLENGDVINIDITTYVNGYHCDCSEMFVVGDQEPTEDVKRLLQTTYDCWILAMEYAKPKRQYKNIGTVIEEYVTKYGYTTVKDFCGHGIGSLFHTLPNIYHHKNNINNGVISPGHTFTIEPMICEGSHKYITWPDGWTIATEDGKKSAQFEHTLLATEFGVEALTAKIDGTSKVQFWEKESKIHGGFWLGTTCSTKEYK